MTEYGYVIEFRHWYPQRRTWSLVRLDDAAGDDFANVYAEFIPDGDYGNPEERWLKTGKWVWSAVPGRKAGYHPDVYVQVVKDHERAKYNKDVAAKQEAAKKAAAAPEPDIVQIAPLELIEEDYYDELVPAMAGA